VKYEGNCKDCRKNIDFGCDAYWSKHNGIWCMDCSKKLYPKVVVSTSLFSISRTVVKKEKAVS